MDKKKHRRSAIQSSRSRGKGPSKRSGDLSEKALIEKELWKPATLLYPVPVVMVSCADAEGRANIVTVAWAGTICSDPPMLSISLRPERYSYELIKRSGEFVVNIPSVDQIPATDYCGVVSGRDVDKLEVTGLTAAPASKVKAPLLLECLVNLECRVTKSIALGSHVLFLAGIEAVQVSRSLLTANGRLALERAGLAAYAHGGYYALGRKLGFFGFSVQKRRKPTRSTGK